MSIQYDGAYKRVFSFREVIEHFAKAYLRGDWQAAVLWETLELCPTEHVSPEFERRDNDLVWRVSRRDGSGLYIYLMLEFQSGVDRGMAVRINRYMAMLIEDDWLRRDKGQRWRVPTVLPVVVYTGSAPWTAGLELVPEWPQELRALEEYGQRLRYLLVEAGTATEVTGERANLADGLFRIERAKDRSQLVAALGWMRKALSEAGNPELDAASLGWFNDVYVPSRVRGVRVEQLTSWKEAPEMVEQHFDSWADAWIAKGEKRGIAKGEERGAEAGRKELLVKQVRKRYGAGAATAIAPLLDEIRSLPALDEIGLWIVDGNSADDLLAKLRKL